MKSEWKVQMNVIAGKKLYIPYRIKDTSEVVHSGNIEHYGNYTESCEEAEKIAEMLNASSTDV